MRAAPPARNEVLWCAGLADSGRVTVHSLAGLDWRSANPAEMPELADTLAANPTALPAQMSTGCGLTVAVAVVLRGRVINTRWLGVRLLARFARKLGAEPCRRCWPDKGATAATPGG